MSRRQTRTMVRWESVVISVFGGLLGLAVGVLFGALAVSALRDEGFEVLEGDAAGHQEARRSATS